VSAAIGALLDCPPAGAPAAGPLATEAARPGPGRRDPAPGVPGAPRGPVPGGPAPLRIGPCVRFSKADAFEICGALALAESVLRALGRGIDADLVGAVFEVAEAGLARASNLPDGAAAGGPGRPRQTSGANSIARELTQ
jgi:hypothetical protein